VLFSTHILADVERVCDQVAILDCGRVVRQAPMAELTRRTGAQQLLVEVTGSIDALAAEFAAASWASAVAREGALLTLTVSDLDAAGRAVPAAVAAAGAGLVRLEPAEAALEDVFVELVGGER